MKKTIMKKSLLALCALAVMPTLSFAQSITVGSASGPAGGSAAPLPLAIVFAQNAAPTAANTVRDIDVRLTYNPALLTITAAPGAAPSNCVINTAGTVIISVPDIGTPIAGGTICNLTAINIAAAAPAGPLTLTLAKGVGSGCINGVGTTANCVYNNGTITVGGVPPVLAPTVGPLTTPVALTGGVGSVPVNVATAGTAGGSLALACTIPATGASAFAITGGANRTITGPAALGANAPAIGLSCVPGAALVSATLTCTQTATPGGVLAPLTSTVNCPAVPGITITPNLLGGTAAAPTTLTIANTVVPLQPIGTVINITGLTVTGAGFVAPATGSWGACIYSPDLAPPAGSTSNPGAFMAGPQLVFNSTNNGVAQPQVIGATRQAGSVSAIVTCPVSPAGTLPAATANVYRLVLAAGAPGVVVPVTPPGALTLPAYTLPIATSFRVLEFNATGAPASVSCVFTTGAFANGSGYTATPNPLNITEVGTPRPLTVTYTGTIPGTFAGTLVCTPVAPATGGPFTYTFTTVVSPAVVVNSVQVPALGNISLMLLVAGFLGLGMVLVGRRQA